MLRSARVGVQRAGSDSSLAMCATSLFKYLYLVPRGVQQTVQEERISKGGNQGRRIRKKRNASP